MLRVTQEESRPGLDARWIDVSGHLHEGCGCARASALVVSVPGGDLWVCCALAPAGVPEGDARAAVDAMLREPGADVGALRCSAAFGMPWGGLTEEMLRTQLLLLRSSPSQPFHAEMRRSSPEQLLMLREALSPGTPRQVAQALTMCREYAGSTQ